MRRSSIAAAFAACAGLAACADAPSLPVTAISQPVDFAYACEGAGRTVAPTDGERVRDRNDASPCATFLESQPGAAAREVTGDFLGIVLNQDPPGALVVQLPSLNSSRGGIVDADPFQPGATPIPVGDAPIRILTASDFSAFYVLNAGSKDVTRIVIRNVVGRLERCAEPVDPNLTPSCFQTSTFDLPGVPSDGAIVGERLFVTAASRPELWVYDLTATEPTATIVKQPDRIDKLEPLGDDGFVVTWLQRPVLSRLDADGNHLPDMDAGIVAACADGLDNDGDGLVDHADPGCYGIHDADETDWTTTATNATEPPASYGAVPLCQDGIDNDGNGMTDDQDPRCEGDLDGERLAECEDGLDNDGNGLTDTDDPACYGAGDRFENGIGPFGPFVPTLVDAGPIGRWIYVLDRRQQDLAVFEVAADGSLVRVGVPGHESVAPEIEYRAYVNTERQVLDAVRGAAQPAVAAAGQQDLPAPSSPLKTVLGTPVRGELWIRNILPEAGQDRAQIPQGLSTDGTLYTPSGCDPDIVDVCVRPELDDDNVFVFAPRMDGRTQVIQAVLRGEPRHRYAQSQRDPSLRGHDIPNRPVLSLRGNQVAVTAGSIPQGYAFMGAMTEVTLEPKVDEISPARVRRWGIWPPEDFEQVPTEGWALTYQGAIPGASGQLGRLVDTGATFYAPDQRFCEHGVEVGDWLELEAAPSTVAPDLRYDLSITTSGGAACILKEPEIVRFEAPIVEVGMRTVTVDPAQARLVPVPPELDEKAMREAGDGLYNACLDAWRAIRDERFMLPGDEDYDFVATDAWSAENMPSRLSYRVRAGDTWVVQGGVSGYRHRWEWDGSQCFENTGLDARLTGRVHEATFEPDQGYVACPPPAAQTAPENIEDLIGTEDRFSNYSFSIDMLPACGVEGGEVILVPSRRDTRWSFVVEGPDSPATIGNNAGLVTRMTRMEFRHNVVQVDTGGDRMSVLEFKPADTSAIFAPTYP